MYSSFDIKWEVSPNNNVDWVSEQKTILETPQ